MSLGDTESNYGNMEHLLTSPLYNTAPVLIFHLPN